MSFQFNSDREEVRGLNPKIIGENSFIVRSGSGSGEKEVLRAQLDSVTNLPRVGINRTGRRVESIQVNEGQNGTGYTVTPFVVIDPPDLPNGVQAQASAVIQNGFVSAIIVDNPGDGYSTAPNVTISGGNGTGAQVTAFLDTVDFELDINGAIRTSTSIISDTARILNLDIDNFVTPDADFRGPNLKTWANNTGVQFVPNTTLQKDSYRYFSSNIYQALNTGVTGSNPPVHTDGIETNGTVQLKHIGYRVTDPNAPHYNLTGDSGVFPRSITPLLGDKSDKIATTEYVLNLATNDVGGRVYVSQQIGNDDNDGRSAVAPVRTIKRACQIASQTVGVKETVIVSGGDYVEDNPISIPPDCSVVGDNLRLVIVRPANPGKHMFKFGDKNYITGLTFRDQIDSNGDPVATWDFAMVFDDKQRIYYDVTTGGDFERRFPVGHQIFGPPRSRIFFQANTGLSLLTTGLTITGVNTGAVATIDSLVFDETTGQDAYIIGSVDVSIVSGAANAGETFEYTVSGVTYEFVSTQIKSIRAEGEVVSVDKDLTSELPIVRVDFSKQGDPETSEGGFQYDPTEDNSGGIIFYTNEPIGRQNIHNFKEGQEIELSGFPTADPDLSFLNGKTRIYKILRDADGRSRRFIVQKKTTVVTSSNYTPPLNAAVKSYDYSVTLTLLNSPNKFPEATPVSRRYQDACLLIRNNIDFIADEVLRKINDEYANKYFEMFDVGSNTFKVYTNPNNFTHTYVSGGTVTHEGNTYTVTNLNYNNVTGVGTITVTPNLTGAATGDKVKIENILVSCNQGQKLYPSFNIPISDSKCRRDIGHFLSAILRDLEFGSNYNVIEAAKYYVEGTKIGYVDGEIIETVKAFERAKDLAVFAMRGWRTGNGTPSDPLYVPQYSSVERYFDPTVIIDSSSPACADVASAINTLGYLFVEVLTNNVSDRYLDASNLIARNEDFIAFEALGYAQAQYPSLGLSQEKESKCLRDVRYILSALRRDLILGGNAGMVTAAESYFTGTQLTGIPTSELAATRFAFEKVRDLSILAMRNWKTGSNGTGPVYTPSYETTIPLFTDNTIIVDTSTPICNNVASAITSSFSLFDSILGGTVSPGATTKTYGTLYEPTITNPDSIIYDADNKTVTPRSYWDDYPIIEASPYTQNSSIISFLGGSGALVDGSKVAQPNCPFPGLEQPLEPGAEPRASFPNQGKSMVAAAFTIVSFGGTGYKVINDGYTQLVSVFVIFCADGVLAETGGYASITNSATNFGIYALRATGYNDFAYEFDVGLITSVSISPSNRTTITASGFGREPLEHYIVKIDGYRNTNTEIEYFVDGVSSDSPNKPFTAILTLEDGSGGGQASFTNISTGSVVDNSTLVGKTIRLHRPSIVNSSSHTWEFAGSGTNYNALPENGGVKDEANEQVSEDYGRVYVSGTDELGDFKVGTFARIENRTGNITFTGTVTISEVEFLKLRGGDVVVTGFDASNSLGGANASDSKLPTQKAVRDYITNNLGPYINKPYSTSPVPRALVELNDSGKISLSQIPPIPAFTVYTVDTEAERLQIEGVKAGDIAIQTNESADPPQSPISYILNNDLDSLYVGFNVDTDLEFDIGAIYTGSNSGGKIQATEYREGVVYQVNITEAGSGYTVPPTVTISGGNPQPGAVPANVVATIANGQVVTLKIVEFNGYIGGKGYTTQPLITLSAPGGAGITATANILIESRLYGDIVNNLQMDATEINGNPETIQSSNSPAETVEITRVVNTSGFDSNNWVSLSTNQIAANDITSGVIDTARLAVPGGTYPANSFTFLRGDRSYVPAVQSIKAAETRYFARLQQTVPINGVSLVFTTNSDVGIGHGVVASVSGIQSGTTISEISTDQGLTEVLISQEVTSEIPAGTVLEFTRGASPILFDSSYTLGNFVESIVIVNGGTGYTNGQYFGLELTGGAGTGLTANIVVSGGAVTEIFVVNSGINYNADFNITVAPTDIGSGTGLVLGAKIGTISRQYANTTLDIRRAGGLGSTPSTDPYGTVGVARFLKSQFDVGIAGNGSVVLKTGADSGLNADLLDGEQGSYYLNGIYFFDNSIGPTKLSSGTYNISVSGSSGFTFRITSNSVTTSPNPDATVSGITAETRTNVSDGLSDGGSRHLVMTVRNGGSGTDNALGGVRQLAFTDNNNMWLRGSGTGYVSGWSDWGKVWTSKNDASTGTGSGPDAWKLNGKIDNFYKNALNLNFGTISTNRLPVYQNPTTFNNTVKIASTINNLNPRYTVYISGYLLTTSPFLVGLTVKPFDAGGIETGELQITSVVPVTDSVDASGNYTLITGVLLSGDFNDAVNIGTTAFNVPFQDYTLNVNGTFDVASLTSDGGTGRLKLGRKDGTASNPAIYFNSSALAAANYNAAIVSSGGNSNDGSGSLNVIVGTNNSLTVNNNIVWNAGNVTFNSTNVASTAVIRDASGNFSAGTITAALTGAASGNVLKTGDTMTGSLSITGPTSNLTVGGTLGVTGNTTLTANLTVDTNTLFVDATNNSVNIGTITHATGFLLNVNGKARIGAFNGGHLAILSSNAAFGWVIDTNDAGSGTVPLRIYRKTNSVDSLVLSVRNQEGDITPGANGTQDFGSSSVRWDNIFTNVLDAKTSIKVNDASGNTGAPIVFAGSSGFRNFRIGNQLAGDDLFEISPSTANGNTTFNTTTNPGILMKGSNGNVGIGVNSISNDYRLEVAGSINFTGTLFQNGVAYVTSRWTQSSNTTDIHRLSKVGINKADPSYPLDVSGDANVTGVLRSNGDKQWLDTYGVFKANRNTIAENVTVPTNTNCVSAGPITINNGYTITIQDGASWSVV